LPDDRHQQAFEVYAASGPKRTYKQVADQMGVSDRTVRHWAKQEKWRQRLGERAAQAARQLADQTLQSSVEELSRNEKIVQLALVRLAKSIANGQVRMQLGDLDRLIRLQAFLEGYREGQTWDEVPPVQLARRFHITLKRLSDEDLEAFYQECKRLGSERPKPPALSSPASNDTTNDGVTHEAIPRTDD